MSWPGRLRWDILDRTYQAAQNKLYVLPQYFLEKLCARAKKTTQTVKKYATFFQYFLVSFFTKVFILT